MEQTTTSLRSEASIGTRKRKRRRRNSEGNLPEQVQTEQRVPEEQHTAFLMTRNRKEKKNTNNTNHNKAGFSFKRLDDNIEDPVSPPSPGTLKQEPDNFWEAYKAEFMRIYVGMLTHPATKLVTCALGTIINIICLLAVLYTALLLTMIADLVYFTHCSGSWQHS